MGYEQREFPHFSWSHSRDSLLTECQQAYYSRYFLSHNGWEREAPAEARQAWTLEKLVSVSSALGVAVHQRALECAAALEASEPLPDATVLIERVRAELNTLRLRHDVSAFIGSTRLVAAHAGRRGPHGASSPLDAVGSARRGHQH